MSKTKDTPVRPGAQRPRYRLFSESDWTEYRVYAGDALLSGGVVQTRREAIRLARLEIGRLQCR